MNKIPHILFVARDDGGCGFYRCRQPAAFLKRAGFAEIEVAQSMATDEQMLWADLVIMQEMGSLGASKMAKFLINHKIPYVSEIDDFLHHVSPHNEAGYGAWNPNTLFLPRAIEIVRSGFAMTVSTNQLAREYFPYNPLIYVVPNFLDKEKWDQPIVKRRDGKIRIGWAGGNAHADDLKMVVPVIEKIIAERKGKVIFETFGMTKQELHGVFNITDTHGQCTNCGFEGDLHHYPGEAYNNYPNMLASKGWDIAIAPVINNAFGNCKSDIKIKEMAAVGLPVVASRVVAYVEAQKDGAEIYVAETFDEWYNSLNDLIDDAENRENMGTRNKKWIQKHWIDDNITKIFEAYSQLLAQAETLLGPRENRK